MLRLPLLILCLGMAHLSADTPKVDFNRDVRPVLSENCFACHGPDEKTLKAGLRLDKKEGAHSPAKSGAVAVMPGNPDKSEMIRRITTDDEDDHMPPAKTGKRLKAEQIALLRQWIAEGGNYSAHWSFVAPTAAPPPALPGETGIRNAIDAFILARLKRDGLTFSPEADRNTLIRRVTLDLTGLPPTPQEIDAFLADTSANAYEKLVDRLLASPRYGERMTLEWLDAARFADTHGYHIDSARDMSGWRDWVIRAFNRNMRFNQFTVEQLAGDLLPGATEEQKVASGFNRNHMINFEGGAIPEEYHTAYVMDRVSTTSTVWLGLTMTCAQCHDHKYDPLTMKDFYSFYAFFNNVPENGLDGRNGNAAPVMNVPMLRDAEETSRLQAALAAAQQAEKDAEPRLAAAQAEWEKSALNEASWQELKVESAKSTGGSALKLLADSVLATGPNPGSDLYEVRCLPANGRPATVAGLKLDALMDDSLAGKGPGRAANGNFVLTGIAVEIGGQPRKISSAQADYEQRNFPISNVIDDNAASGWAVDGDRKHEPRSAWFALDQPVALQAGESMKVSLRFESTYGQHAIGRFRLGATSSSVLARSGGGQSLNGAIAAILQKPAPQRTAEESAALRTAYRATFSAEARQLRERIAAAQQALQGGSGKAPTVMVMAEKPGLRETFMLERGQYDKRTNKVSADTPASLPPMKPDQPKNRLGLAQWLVSGENPLTARVTVNRFWQMYFGAGIVKSAENLGSQADWPTHPELLDWLAVEFVRSGWDVKAMQRLIVTSAAYRQRSATLPEHLEKDPENRLLSRGARVRLPAEHIRDLALFVSGLLDPRIGGASASPYQPAGLWEELMAREDGDSFTAQKFVQSHGPDLYRRGMYTFWKRTSPPANLSTLDAPDREVCAVRRPRTNTPLQALTLMNDVTFVEAARKLAERLLKEAPDDASRLALAGSLVLGRPLRKEEASVLLKLKSAEAQRFAQEKTNADALLGIGESPREAALPAAELAAWTLVCNTLLNLDETITRN